MEGKRIGWVQVEARGCEKWSRGDDAIPALQCKCVVEVRGTCGNALQYQTVYKGHRLIGH